MMGRGSQVYSSPMKLQIRFTPLPDEQMALMVAGMLEKLTGDPVRVTKWIRGKKFKLERFDGSKWVKG
jgi:hypothetical protein